MSTKIASAAVAALVTGLSAFAAPAEAGSTDIYFGIGIPAPVYHYRDHGGPYYDRSRYRGHYRDRPYYGRPYPGYGAPRYVRSRISCGEGADSARDEGFRRVRPIDCEGRNYSYRGYRHGDAWHIRVDSRTGDIINARPLRY